MPGRPKTSVSPRRPNHSGLPGLICTRQNTSSTPQLSNAGLTWSCGPTETPPDTTSTSPSSPASTASRVVSKSSPITPWSTTDGAGALGQQADHQPVRLVDPARLGRGAERQQLAAGDDQVQPRAAVDRDLADAGRGERGDAREGERVPRRAPAPSPARRSSPRRRMWMPGRQRPLRRHAAVLLDRELGLQDRRRRPAGSRRPWRRAPPSRARAAPWPPRRPPRRPPAAAPRRGRCRRRAPRSRPSPSGRTAAGRRRSPPARRPRARPPRPAARARRPAAPARSSTSSSASSTEIIRRSATSSGAAGRTPDR